MPALIWSAPEARRFESGLSHGAIYPHDSEIPPLVWNGLISVDSEGSEESTTHYIDGRPFFNRQIPQEYEATVTAYTFPSEFPALMGMDEAAPGFYVDSQNTELFNLTYKTQDGSMLDPDAKDYKLHLVYNATAGVQGQTYSTFNSSGDPTEFSWQLKAVPDELDGLRASAHLVLSSREVDPARLAMIEEILYGTDLVDPAFPSASEVADILRYGDTIIITDIGDGMWTAEGASRNIYYLDEADGVFEIDNVDAVDHGDGTYDISSTNV